MTERTWAIGLKFKYFLANTIKNKEKGVLSLEKLKEIYKSAEIELILLGNSDIVTASDQTGGLVDNDPNDWGDWTKT